MNTPIHRAVFLFCSLAAGWGACASASSDALATPEIVTTHPTIAKKNLDFGIAQARARRDEKTLVELLLTRAAFYNSFDDLDDADTRCAALLNKSVLAPELRLLCVRVLTTVHRYNDALEQLELAESSGASATDIDLARSTIAVAIGMPAARAKSSVASATSNFAPTYRSLTAGGITAAASNQRQRADEQFRKALKVYSDVSPYAVAWVYGQLGDLWVETKPVLAATYYRQALTHLPDFVRVNIELAQVEHAAGEIDLAKARLALAATVTNDPDVLANRFLLSPASIDAAATNAVQQGFETLLKKQPLAFADHAAEFYEGVGASPERAKALREILAAEKQAARARLSQPMSVASSALE